MRYTFRAAINAAVEGEAQFVERCAPWMRERLGGRGPWRCWVAEDGGRVIGHLWLCLIEKIPNPAPELEQHAYITNVYVRPEGRGSGSGKALMDAALAFCREQRVDSVILWPTERVARFTRGTGFVRPTICWRRWWIRGGSCTDGRTVGDQRDARILPADADLTRFQPTLRIRLHDALSDMSD
jgi:GNAT superfamily N-acetyltransferase